MHSYPKIQSIYKREKKGRFIIGEFSRREFEYLQNNKWIFTEKIDGTNIRIIWNTELTPKVQIRGRTDKAQIPPFLLKKLEAKFTEELFHTKYPDTVMTMYGEGYGARIQKGGGKYIPDDVDFILFDIKLGKYWLRRESIEDIAKNLEIDVVPIVGVGTINDAIRMCREGFTSTFGNFIAEGLVLKPEVDLLMQNGARVITKVKYKDFK